jgi:hypothetical protein
MRLPPWGPPREDIPRVPLRWPARQQATNFKILG